jgi:tripartite-type tricarboxylate transporter receptor subunit TctC
VIVSSNSAGSTPDVVARMVAEGLSRSLNQRFIVENRPGGNSIIATMYVVRARPDGYTLYLSGNSALAANPHMLKSIPYDPMKDLEPVTLVISSAPMMIVVHPSLPVHNVAELVRYAKAQPGKVTYAASGSLAPLLGEILSKRAGIRMRQVRYKSTAESAQDTAAGRTNVNFLGKTMALPLAEQHRVRVIGIAGRERFSPMPDVPALEEDYPGIAMEGWFALLGPAGLPRDIAGRLRRALDPYLRDPQTKKRFQDIGLTTRGAVSAEETRAFIRSEHDRWGRLLREIDFKPR